MKRPILYADANSKIGKVRVFGCPICHDGEMLAEVRKELEAARRVVELVKKYTENDTLVSDLHEALAAYDAARKSET